MLINVYAEDRGWLFEDFKRYFPQTEIPDADVQVVSSNYPLPDADAWICIRTDEWGRCPDPRRCVVQIHDFWEHKSLRDGLHKVGALSLVHPQQEEEWAIPGLRRMMRPIGARRLFQQRTGFPDRFTVGWCGRRMRVHGQDIKRRELFEAAVIEAIRRGHQVLPLFCDSGDSSNSRHQPFSEEELVNFYNSIDVLVVTALPEPGPLSMWEALASGVPVLAAERWLAIEGPHVRLFDPNVDALADILSAYPYIKSGGTTPNPGDITEWWGVHGYWQEDWMAANVELAMEVGKR